VTDLAVEVDGLFKFGDGLVEVSSVPVDHGEVVAGDGFAGAITRIDYLALLSRDHHRQPLRERGVADPGQALVVSVTGWLLANAITGGRLLPPTPASPG
jgi:hypothetical protein